MKKNRNENSSNNCLIEQQIKSIFMGLVSNLPQDLVAVRVNPSKGSVLCKGLVKIYNKAEMGEAAGRKERVGYPLETYAFYTKDFHDSKLESIAIYGEEVSSKYFILKRKGVLFGYRIASLKIESGLRPFLDVKLAV